MPTKKKTTEEIKPYIEKLAAVLRRLETPDEIKKSWANLIPVMSVKQIECLIGILTELPRLPMSASPPIIEKVQKIYAEFLNKIKEIEIARDQKVFSIIRKAEQKQIEAIRSRLSGS